ncbi:hypothetical protein RN001_000222 [Aquatica leii]|uniref:Mitochondrial potassium channel ATP-binding subunit n=1 Tax=Aquatica leii TaxID=1421715 RepID=A0AAN7SC40_9COLE|nr:hypothetical protein RN001_000222 [Aquatica leii]
MWKLFHCSTKINLNLSLISNILLPRRLLSVQKNSSLKLFRSYYIQPIKNKRQYTFTFSTVSRIGLTITTGTVLKLCLLNKVYCKAPISRLAGYKVYNDKNLGFDWKKLLEYIKPHVWYLVAAILGAIAVAILNIQMPLVMSAVVNILTRFTDTKDVDNFFKEMKLPSIQLISMYITQSVLTAFYITMLSHLGERVAFDIKTDLFANILRQDVSFFDQQRTGEILTRLTSDVQDFKSSFKQSISGGLRAVTQIIGCSVSLIIISPQMTFVTLLCIPAIIAIGSTLGGVLRNTSRKAQAQVEKTTAIADEAVSNIRTVRAFAMEDLETDMFKKEAYWALELNEQLGFGIGLFQGGANLFLNGMVLATLYMGGYLLSVNQLSPGQLMAYLMATQTVQKSLGQVSLLFGTVVRGMAAGSRVFQFIDLKPKMPLVGGKTIINDQLKGEIEFKDVIFAYPTRPQQIILQNLNLKIPAGKTVAIVGGSGNGKSTIAALIERFYDIDKGAITLDGEDISTLDPSWLRRNVIGYICQEPILFATSIMENIRYGYPDATDQEVMEAAQLANAHNFISDFPDGYHTLVGERGTTLSGGQKQRIAIARALLKNPTVLILDEATSALDVESEKIVQAALDKARLGRTVLIIAHRLSTIKNADLIVVLNKGKIVEMGTHEQLRNLKGHYWSINFRQQHDADY